MPEHSHTPKGGALSTKFATDFGIEMHEIHQDVHEVRLQGFDPADWLAAADSAGMQVWLVLHADKATANRLCFGGIIESPSVKPDVAEADPLQQLCHDGFAVERSAVIAAYILSNEPDRVCVVRGES